jgi:hypothetical protein
VSDWPAARWSKICVEELGDAVELFEAVAWLEREGRGYECWRVVWGSSEPLSILFVPSFRQAGVSWGLAPAEWTACDSAEEALRRYLAAEMKGGNMDAVRLEEAAVALAELGAAHQQAVALLSSIQEQLQSGDLEKAATQETIFRRSMEQIGEAFLELSRVPGG